MFSSLFFFFPLFFCSAPILSSPKNLPFFLAALGAAAVASRQLLGSLWGGRLGSPRSCLVCTEITTKSLCIPNKIPSGSRGFWGGRGVGPRRRCWSQGSSAPGVVLGEKNIPRRGFPSFELWLPSERPTHVQLLDPNPLISEFLPRISERFPGTSREAAPAPHFKDPKK